jgi:hypothetical protein
MKALSELSTRISRPIVIGSPLADQVFEWFKTNTKPGAHAIGAMFTGVFYYDASFWPVTIPVGYGEFHLNPLNALESMPAPLRQTLWQETTPRGVYLHYWADCFDYGYGVDILLRSERLDERARRFLKNADGELRTAVAPLLTLRPTLKAILGFRMACEIFMKVFLIQEKNLSDQDLRTLGHHIDRLARACSDVRPLKEFDLIEQGANAFPGVAERYDGEPKNPYVVFDAAFLTQLTAATITRLYSPYDTRPQMTVAP